MGPSLFLAILPLAYAFVMDLALQRNALSHQSYLDTLWVFHLMSAPGLMLSKVFAYEPLFWVEHSRGIIFWEDLAVFILCNLVGWVLVLGVLRVIIRGVAFKLRAVRREAPQ